MRKLLFAVLAFFAVNAEAVIVGPIPNNLTNGTTIDAVPVMANYNWIMNQVNANGAPLASPTFTGTVTGGAGGFVGNLVGNASTCTAAGITDDTTTNATMYPTWATADTGNLPLKTSHSKLTWNPSTGTLGATTFSGALSGNASTATTAGTVTTAAQPNITSVGTLTSLGVAGDVTAASGEAILSNSTTTGVVKLGESASSGIVQNSTGSSQIRIFGPTNGTPNIINFLTNSASAGTIDAAQKWRLSSLGDINGNLIISSTAPTIASGFGTSPSIVAANTAAFRIVVGSGGTDSLGTITFPAASTGWVCSVQNITNPLPYRTAQIAYGTTQVQVGNINPAGTSYIAWTAGDVLLFQCAAF